MSDIATTPEMERAKRDLAADKEKFFPTKPVTEPDKPSDKPAETPAEQTPPPVEPQPEVTTSVQAPPPASEEADELRKQLAEEKARTAELTRRVNAEDGKRGRELQTLRETVSKQQEALTKAIEQLETLQKKTEDAGKPQISADLKDIADLLEGVPQEDLEAYDQRALRTLARIAQNAAAKRSVSEKNDIEELRKAQNDTSAQTQQEAFLNATEILAPGFKAANGNPALGIPADEKWAAFLQTKANPEISDETWFDVAQRIGTPQVAANAFKRYQAEKNKPAETPRTPPKSDRPSVAGQVAPSRSSAAAVTPPQPKGEVLKRSDYEALQKEMIAGIFKPDSQDRFRKYQLAEFEGRLV